MCLQAQRASQPVAEEGCSFRYLKAAYAKSRCFETISNIGNTNGVFPQPEKFPGVAGKRNVKEKCTWGAAATWRHAGPSPRLGQLRLLLTTRGYRFALGKLSHSKSVCFKVSLRETILRLSREEGTWEVGSWEVSFPLSFLFFLLVNKVSAFITHQEPACECTVFKRSGFFT